MVEFSDDWNDSIPIIGNPEDFESKVDKNKKITWTAVAKNRSTPVTIESVKREGGAEIMKQITRENSNDIYTEKIRILPHQMIPKTTLLF